MAVYIVGVVLVPTYVNSFIVKPNELGRETPYIEHNITWTRRAFGLEQIELREFEAENSVEALNLAANRATLENIRRWDWRACRHTQADSNDSALTTIFRTLMSIDTS